MDYSVEATPSSWNITDWIVFTWKKWGNQDKLREEISIVYGPQAH